MSEETRNDAVELATELTIAWLGNQSNRIAADDVPAFLRTIHSTLRELEAGFSGADDGAIESASEPDFTPAVTVRKSLASRDHILSMIDGKPYKTLRRHLSKHGLTPEDYRRRYRLKPDYPMVSEAYSEQRRAMAMKIGLGARGRAAKKVASAPAPKPVGRGRAKSE